MLSNDPFIKVIDKAISDDVCDRIIEIFESSPNRAAGRTGGGVDESKKRSTDVSIQRFPEFDSVRKHVIDNTTVHITDYFKEFYFALIGPLAINLKHPKDNASVAVTNENFTELALPKLPEIMRYIYRLGDINAQKYDKNRGGYPYWHSEIYPQQNNIEALHRNLLFMYYLNDVAEGGETEFYYQQFKIKPKKGTMVIAPAGFTHTHRGNMPISNDKYILTSWVLFNPSQVIFQSNT